MLRSYVRPYERSITDKYHHRKAALAAGGSKTVSRPVGLADGGARGWHHAVKSR